MTAKNSVRERIVARIQSMLFSQEWEYGFAPGHIPDVDEVGSLLNGLVTLNPDEYAKSGGILVEREDRGVLAIYVQVGQYNDGQYEEVFNV